MLASTYTRIVIDKVSLLWPLFYTLAHLSLLSAQMMSSIEILDIKMSLGHTIDIYIIACK